jgi:thioredoxin
MLKKIDSKAHLNEILKNNQKVVLKFYADWCGPCRMITPPMEGMAEKYKENIVFYEVNVDSLSDVAQEHNVSALPTIIFFHNSKEFDKIIGANLNSIMETAEKLSKH